MEGYEDIFYRLNISPMQIADERTIQLLTMYMFYRNNPRDAFDNIPQIWWESVFIFNQILGV